MHIFIYIYMYICSRLQTLFAMFLRSYLRRFDHQATLVPVASGETARTVRSRNRDVAARAAPATRERKVVRAPDASVPFLKAASAVVETQVDFG